jgi:transmembrane sensor
MNTNKNSFEIAELIFRLIRNEITTEEKEILDQWLAEKPENIELLENITNEENINNKMSIYMSYDKQKAWDRINNTINLTRQNQKVFVLRILKYAAAILFPFIIGGYILLHITNKNKLSDFSQIKTGTQKACLILESGQAISLGDQVQKKIISGSVSTIIDTNNTLSYEKKTVLFEEKQEIFNTLQTPQGGEYNLILADGSRIWLNAASEIKYPVSFNDTVRMIYLKGEAYFEVAHNESQPFIVVTNNIEITVLGTSFDVMAYNDESKVKTTLVQGNVMIETIAESIYNRKEVHLQPGQQAILDIASSALDVKKVDTEIFTAWKQGKFVFSNETLDEIMRKLQRWYGFETRYDENELKNYHFSGTLERYDNISNILKMIEMTTQIKFEAKDNIITVKKNNN